MTTRVLHAWWWALCTLWFADAVHAQAPGVAPSDSTQPAPAASSEGQPLPSLRDSLLGQALVDYEAGRILAGDEDYPGALVKFQRAFEQAGDVRLLWNMAVCHKNLRHYAEVLRLVERYDREGARFMTPEHREEVEGVLRTVRMLVSTIQITAHPSPAQLFVDDVFVGDLPRSEPLLVDLGTRRIRIARSGYKDYVIAQNFAGASTVTFDVTLTPEVHAGKLTVTAGAEDAIRVDGRLMGHGQWQGTLPSGEHNVRVEARSMRPYAKDLVIEDGKQRALYVTLEKEKSSISPLLWAGASVIIAGGLATGGYFLFRSQGSPQYKTGTWDDTLLQ